MSVQVEQLTKTFGNQKAVDQVSFQARKGEILGFLGPNGAGKSTTMKIITGFIPQTEGSAKVCGLEVAEAPGEISKKVGYLPEHNPLYKDMYVREYLEFVARIHHLNNKQARVREMIFQTGLEREQHKPIGALSKGYRQRVGLAQALIHEPEVLILDEPTSGLDPNQLVEIRQLIKGLGKEKTVIFSTHIMQEVQALCDRVLIINRGRIVANDSMQELQSRIEGGRAVSVLFKESSQVKASLLQKIPGIRKVQPGKEGRWLLSAEKGIDPRESVFRFSVDQGLTLLEMGEFRYSMEDIFQQLTRN